MSRTEWPRSANLSAQLSPAIPEPRIKTGVEREAIKQGYRGMLNSEMAKPTDRIERLKEKILSGEWGKETGKNSEDADPEIPYRVHARFSAKALRANYQSIQTQVRDSLVLPMVKAEGYGHGAAWVIKTLLESKNLAGFGVATLDEAQSLQKVLTEARRPVPLTVFSGTAHWTEDKARLCEKNGWIATIADDDDWRAFYQRKDYERVKYQLKFNTGMNRLGISVGRAEEIAQKLRKLQPAHRPQMILSHLASAELPQDPLSQKQLAAFTDIRRKFSAFNGIHISLANSSAIWNSKHWQIEEGDVIRPGIALYGVPPWQGAPARGISPVATVTAQVLKVVDLKRGERIGYGGTYKANEDQRVAILGAGYGDGLPRSFSNAGWVHLNGQAERFRGIVSMDLSAVSCHPRTKPGDWAEILGNQVDAWAQAHSAQSIPYELLTSLFGVPRIERSYGE